MFANVSHQTPPIIIFRSLYQYIHYNVYVVSKCVWGSKDVVRVYVVSKWVWGSKDVVRVYVVSKWVWGSKDVRVTMVSLAILTYLFCVHCSFCKNSNLLADEYIKQMHINQQPTLTLYNSNLSDKSRNTVNLTAIQFHTISSGGPCFSLSVELLYFYTH